MFRLLTLSFGSSHLTLVFLYSTHPRCVSSLCLCTSPLVSLYLSHTPTLSFLLSLSLSGRGVWGEAGLFASHGFLRWLGYTHCHTACQRMVCVSHRLLLLPHCMAWYLGCVIRTVWLCVFNSDKCCQWATFVLYLYCFFAPPAGEKWFISPWMWFLFFSLHSLYNFCLMCGDFVASCH